jgi:hypothetical protein
MRLPTQSPPISRELRNSAAVGNGFGVEGSRTGVIPAQTVCDHLTGLAQQMCYAVEYGVSM